MSTKTQGQPLEHAILNNRRIVEEAFARFANGDLAGFAETLAEDVLWRFYGKGVLAGTYRGRGEVLSFLQKAFALSNGTLRVENIEVLGGPRHAAVYNRVTATRSGKTYDGFETDLILVRDGKIAEWHITPADQYAWDSVWS